MPRSRRRRRTGGGLLPLGAILIAAGVAAYVYYSHLYDYPSWRVGPAPAPAPAVSTQPGVSETTPATQSPVPVREDPLEPAVIEAPLPPLAESDALVRATLEALWGPEAVGRFLVSDDLVSRFVATIDNLPNPKLALKLRPMQPLEGSALARRESSRMVLGEEHFARYAPLVSLVEATSADQLEVLYLRFHPLLQQAYEDLGYPGHSFEDRLVEVIDHLLETPEVPGPIAVVRPKVYYEFADPAIEERSAGQKLLIRMGPRNAAIVKRRLRALRERLTPADAVE